MKYVDNICDFDEGYDRNEAYDIGWCYKCTCNPNCPYRQKAKKEMKNKRNR